MSDRSSQLQVAIVGSGPAGYYTAEALANKGGAVRIDILDRLPTPFGLIRGGVAPDHQTIKQVAKRYEKTALKENVRFAGNLEVGRDITIPELLEIYDAVVLATGAPGDRALGIPGEDLPGVWGSGAFVGWYNSHPDFVDLDIRVDVSSVAVIGNGNVAVDVVRVLAKTAAEMASSDLAAHAADRIHNAPIRDIWMFGRRGPLEASFTPKELGELGELERCVALVDPAQLPAEESAAEAEPAKRKNLAILHRFAEHEPGNKPVRLHLAFYARPVAILGRQRVEALQMERTRVADGKCEGTGEVFEIPCGLVIPCIGYRTSPLEQVPYDERRGLFVNEDGKIADRLYAVGWARRGPTGTIGTNKPDAAEAAERLLAEVEPAGRPGRPALEALVAARGLELVTFRDWKKIDAAETQAAHGAQPRVKFSRIEDMLNAAHPKGSNSSAAE